MEIELRPLRSSDSASLALYFRQLSEKTRTRFAPHAFDEATAHAICENLAWPQIVLVAVYPPDSIVGYTLLHEGWMPGDKERYFQYGIPVTGSGIWSFAPSVADLWQGQGIGPAMFQYALRYLQWFKAEKLVLWGGVQSDNIPAVKFYQHLGFEPKGSFYYNGKENMDMILSLKYNHYL